MGLPIPTWRGVDPLAVHMGLPHSPILHHPPHQPLKTIFCFSYSNQRNVHMGLPIPTRRGADPIVVAHMGLPHCPTLHHPPHQLLKTNFLFLLLQPKEGAHGVANSNLARGGPCCCAHGVTTWPQPTKINWITAQHPDCHPNTISNDKQQTTYNDGTYMVLDL